MDTWHAAEEALRRRGRWALGVLALGVNLWGVFLLLPLLSRQALRPHGVSLLLIGLPLLCLGIGVWAQVVGLLLGVFPLTLLVPAVAVPQLVHASIYRAGPLALVSISLLAYLVGTAFLLRLGQAPAAPTEHRRLDSPTSSAPWPARQRIYRWLSLIAFLGPVALLFALFLHPEVQADLRQCFPDRAIEANALFGVLLLVLWLALFRVYFLGPLRAHVDSDPALRHELQRLRRQIFRRRPRVGFYVAVTAALVLCVLLFLTHW